MDRADTVHHQYAATTGTESQQQLVQQPLLRQQQLQSATTADFAVATPFTATVLPPHFEAQKKLPSLAAQAESLAAILCRAINGAIVTTRPIPRARGGPSEDRQYELVIGLPRTSVDPWKDGNAEILRTVPGLTLLMERPVEDKSNNRAGNGKSSFFDSGVHTFELDLAVFCPTLENQQRIYPGYFAIADIEYA